MNIEFATAIFCLIGWVLHWLFSWKEQWKKEKKGLIDFIDDDPPAFYVSIASTLAVYLLGPSVMVAVLSFGGMQLPEAFSDQVVKSLFAFCAGYMADSFIYKIFALLPRSDGDKQ